VVLTCDMGVAAAPGSVNEPDVAQRRLRPRSGGLHSNTDPIILSAVCSNF